MGGEVEKKMGGEVDKRNTAGGEGRKARKPRLREVPDGTVLGSGRFAANGHEKTPEPFSSGVFSQIRAFRLGNWGILVPSPTSHSG